MEDITQPRNPVTQKAHRRETFWQITIPLIVSILIILGLAIWSVVVASGEGEISQAADASLIFLIIPTMVLALVPLILLGGLVYGMVRLLKFLPPKLYLVQDFFLKLRYVVQNWSDKLAEPVLRVNGLGAAWQAFRGALKKKQS